MNWISPRVARVFTSVPALTILFALIAAAFGTYVADPAVMPSSSILLFRGLNFGELTLICVALGLLGSFVHEIAHAIVARANDFPVTLRISNLMFFIVAQTDITAIRMAPKRQRYLAFFAGVITDLASAAILLFVLYAYQHGTFGLSASVNAVIQAMLLTYLLRVSFQCFLYMRTDLYYIVATAFGAHDLLTDSETLLRNVFYRMTGRRSRVRELHGVGRRERFFIRLYAVIYLVGRFTAFAILFFVLLPVVFQVIDNVVRYLMGKRTYFTLFDTLTIFFLVMIVHVSGMLIWGVSIYRALRRPAPAESVAAPAQSAALEA